MKRPSYPKVIAQMCKVCIYDPIGGIGTWREQVRDCTSPKCPLYPVRPLPSTEKHEWQQAKQSKDRADTGK